MFILIVFFSLYFVKKIVRLSCSPTLGAQGCRREDRAAQRQLSLKTLEITLSKSPLFEEIGLGQSKE